MDKNEILYKREASTWFKGLAIIMIVLSHFAEWWSWFFTEEGNRELVRDGISRFGPYGVAIFFLFSGYGLVKSAGDKRIDWRFVAKRFVNVYIPYLVVVCVIKILSGSFNFENARDFGKFLYGDDFWYMTVLFSFYLAFMVIWYVVENRHVRAILISVFTYWYSNYLYVTGAQEFWYISNIAFAIGVLAVTIFTLFVASFAAVWKWYDPVIPVFGSYSLYFYLTHTFLFMWAVNNGNIHEEMKVRIFYAAVIIAVVSIVMGIIMDILLKPIQNLLKKKN